MPRGNRTTEVRQKPPGANRQPPSPSDLGHARHSVENDPSKILWFKEHHLLRPLGRAEAGLGPALNCLLTPWTPCLLQGTRPFWVQDHFKEKLVKQLTRCEDQGATWRVSVLGPPAGDGLLGARDCVLLEARAGLPTASQEVKRAFCVLPRTCAVYIFSGRFCDFI